MGQVQQGRGGQPSDLGAEPGQGLGLGGQGQTQGLTAAADGGQ